MDINEHTTPNKLERYSFIWSEVRLVFAAIALFLGGYPLIIKLFSNPAFYRTIGAFLTLSWLISGMVSVYLLYRWGKSGRKVFGINLGLVVVFGQNIGMSILSNRLVFVIVGLLYLASAYHLYKRWKANSQKVF